VEESGHRDYFESKKLHCNETNNDDLLFDRYLRRKRKVSSTQKDSDTTG
jgi:hypothetical protein